MCCCAPFLLAHPPTVGLPGLFGVFWFLPREALGSGPESGLHKQHRQRPWDSRRAGSAEREPDVETALQGSFLPRTRPSESTGNAHLAFTHNTRGRC